MKKTNKVVKLSAISADQIAKNLRKSYPRNHLGEDKAYSIAFNLAKNLESLNASDIGNDFFTNKEVKKIRETWKQVANILAKK